MCVCVCRVGIPLWCVGLERQLNSQHSYLCATWLLWQNCTAQMSCLKKKLASSSSRHSPPRDSRVSRRFVTYATMLPPAGSSAECNCRTHVDKDSSRHSVVSECSVAPRVSRRFVTYATMLPPVDSSAEGSHDVRHVSPAATVQRPALSASCRVYMKGATQPHAEVLHSPTETVTYCHPPPA